MKFVIEKEIKDLPADVMEIIKQTGGSIEITYSEEFDEVALSYWELRVEIFGGTDGQAKDMFAALENLVSYETCPFAGSGYSWFICYYPEAENWIEEWEEEMKTRFLDVID